MNALAIGGDEGRSITAISLGEPLNRLRPGDFRMGKPDSNESLERELTQGIETS